MRIESQIGLPGGRIGTVAMETFVRKNRADVAIVRHGRLRFSPRIANGDQRAAAYDQDGRLSNHRFSQLANTEIKQPRAVLGAPQRVGCRVNAAGTIINVHPRDSGRTT
jgi:hypothetical protein